MSVTITAENDTDSPALNMSNSNASRVLSTLGIVGDDIYGGSLPAEDFLGRVLLAQAIEPHDSGVPTHNLSGNFIECGRTEGYVQDRLATLQEVAQYAIDNDLCVVWH